MKNTVPYSGWRLPPERATAGKRLKAIREARARLEQRARSEAEAEEAAREAEAAKKGRRARRKQAAAEPRLADKDRINFTDPESRILRSAGKAFIQGYNAQMTVDADTHVIVAAELTNQATGTPHLVRQPEQVEANTGRYPRELSADAGYYSEANLGVANCARSEGAKVTNCGSVPLSPSSGTSKRPWASAVLAPRAFESSFQVAVRLCSLQPPEALAPLEASDGPPSGRHGDLLKRGGFSLPA